MKQKKNILSHNYLLDDYINDITFENDKKVNIDLLEKAIIISG